MVTWIVNSGKPYLVSFGICGHFVDNFCVRNLTCLAFGIYKEEHFL